MILNVSGRTDVVAFYTPWFLNRIQEGFLDVRNPIHPSLVSRIYFKDVDMILFCTKNPLPILNHLSEIPKPILFHVTLTPYKKDIEPNVPPKGKVIDAIRELSKRLGNENVVVRYDPVFLSKKYNLEYHKKAFSNLCTLLEGSVQKIIISFLDEYQNVKKNRSSIQYQEWQEKDYEELGRSFSKSASSHGMTVQTCFEKKTLEEYGFVKGECLSHEFAYMMTGKKYPTWKARKGGNCACVEMVDVGVYNSCPHFCKYCYANYDEKKVKENHLHHDPNSSLLVGHLSSEDVIKIRRK